MLENELGYDFDLDDERLEESMVDMFWSPRIGNSRQGTEDNISFLWGGPADGELGTVWPDLIAPQLQYLAAMCGPHPQVERRTKLPYPRRLR